MKIRKAKPEDARKLSNLIGNTIDKINKKDYSKKQIEILKKSNTPFKVLIKIKNRNIFCMVEKDKILGKIDLNLEKQRISGLFVNHNHLKKGIGRKLLIFIENYAKKKGIKKLALFSTITAQDFYKKFNYKSKKRTNLIIGGCKFQVIPMEKNLK